MKIKKLLLFLIVIITIIPGFAKAQYLDDKLTNSPLIQNQSSIAPRSNIFLGIGVGPTFFHNETGFNFNFFTEVALESFSVVPQANYWKVKETTNFELAGDIRLHFEMLGLNPYGAAGIGVNFYDEKSADLSFTALGLNLGAGLEFTKLAKGMIFFVDGKYKLIIRNDGNKELYTITGGVKLPL